MRSIIFFFAASALSAIEPLALMDTVTVGSTELNLKALPKGFMVREELGLLTANAVEGQVVHRWQQVLHLTIKESALASLPTEKQLHSN